MVKRTYQPKVKKHNKHGFIALTKKITKSGATGKKILRNKRRKGRHILGVR